MAKGVRCKPGAHVGHDNSSYSRWPLIDDWAHSSKPSTGPHCIECREKHTNVNSAS